MNKKNSQQRKTTLKWNSDGELSEIDMLRILEKISSSELRECELTCDPDQVWILLTRLFINKFLFYKITKIELLSRSFLVINPTLKIFFELNYKK